LWAPKGDFELHVPFKCPTQAQVVLSYLLDDVFHDNYRVQRQLLTAAPGPRKRTTGSQAPQSEGLVCVFDITSTESEATLCDNQVCVTPCRLHWNENVE
jgi:hypothetical protein